MKHQSQEDYLRAIYLVMEKTNDKTAKSVDIAESLGVSKPAVSKMLKKLQDDGLISTNPYSSVSLTISGQCLAQNLTHKHRLIEVFLKDILHVDMERIHDEAHKMEHAFSDDTIEKLGIFLKNPEYCPNGKKIPLINDKICKK